MASAPNHLRSMPGTGSRQTRSNISPQPLKKLPYAPRELDQVAQDYWRDYGRCLVRVNALFTMDLHALKDLCYLESLKHQVREELEGGELVTKYTDENGAVKHTQPATAFSMLKTLQGQINDLRKRFGFEPRSRGGVVLHRSSDMKPANPFLAAKPKPPAND